MLLSSPHTAGVCNFSMVRDTMYKYSKKAEDKFFAEPTLAFLFANFSSSKEGIEYTNAKLFNKIDEKMLNSESTSLGKKSSKAKKKKEESAISE